MMQGSGKVEPGKSALLEYQHCFTRLTAGGGVVLQTAIPGYDFAMLAGLSRQDEEILLAGGKLNHIRQLALGK